MKPRFLAVLCLLSSALWAAGCATAPKDSLPVYRPTKPIHYPTP